MLSIITGSNYAEILDIKAFLQHHLDIRDLDEPKYFLGIESASHPRALVLNQRKYVLDLLQEAGLSGCKQYASPIESKPQLWSTTSPIYSDPKRYRRLVGKLIYLTLTRPDISFTVNVLNQFMHASREVHWEAVICLLSYLKYALGRGLIFRRNDHLHVSGYSYVGFAGDRHDRKSITSNCVYVGGNLVIWRSHKQSIPSMSIAEAEYRARAERSSEMLWERNFLFELGIPVKGEMPMMCDNQASIFIVNTKTFSMRTKHIEIDCHVTRHGIIAGYISTPYVASADQLADIFTKGLSVTSYDTFSLKLGLYDMYALA